MKAFQNSSRMPTSNSQKGVMFGEKSSEYFSIDTPCASSSMFVFQPKSCIPPSLPPSLPMSKKIIQIGREGVSNSRREMSSVFVCN